MNKKILQILTILSFLNFGLTTQKTFAQTINIDNLDLNTEILDNLETKEINLDNIKSSISLKELLQGLSFKDKALLISDLLKYKILEYKKACIITASGITITSALALIYKYGLKKDQ